MGCRPCSEGYISQRLKYYGLKVSPTLKSETIQFVLFLSDEIFANNWPILITIEPQNTPLGHTDIRTTEKYTHSNVESLRTTILKLSLKDDNIVSMDSVSRVSANKIKKD